MGFPSYVAEEALVRCGRCCCICHKFCGTKIEVHHIKQSANGGEDTLENAIPLCFDCHGDMGKTDPLHPKRKQYTEKELKLHRDNWYEKVKNGIYGNDAIYEEDIKLFSKISGVFTEDMIYHLKDKELGGNS